MCEWGTNIGISFLCYLHFSNWKMDITLWIAEVNMSIDAIEAYSLSCYWWFLLTLDRYAQVCKYAFELIWRTSATHHELHSLWVMWSGREKCNCLDISWVDFTSKSDKWKLNKSINSATSHSHFICLSLKSRLSRTVQQKQIRCGINSDVATCLKGE